MQGRRDRDQTTGNQRPALLKLLSGIAVNTVSPMTNEIMHSLTMGTGMEKRERGEVEIHPPFPLSFVQVRGRCLPR